MNIYNTTRVRKVKCKTCGKYFTTSHPSKKTCSVECSCARSQVAVYELKMNNRRYYKNSHKGKKK